LNEVVPFDGDRVAGVGILRRLRETRGWSWADLARALRDTARHLGIEAVSASQLRSVQRAVARWETPAGNTSPGERYQVVLAHLYARTPAGQMALGPGSDFALLLDALRFLGVAEEQVDVLTDVVVHSVRDDRELLAILDPGVRTAIEAAHHGATADTEALGLLADSVARINSRVGAEPFVRLQLRLAPMVETCRRLVADASPSEELLTVSTDVLSSAARLAFETRDDETAMALYEEATTVAGRIPDLRHRASIRTSHTMVTLHSTGDGEAARQIAKCALKDAHASASYAARAKAHAVYAEISARTGETGESRVALERAWKTVDQLRVGDEPSGFTAHRLAGFDGLCALHNGDHRNAERHLASSVDALGATRDAVQRGSVSTDLALARLRLGDAEACVEILHEVVDITADTGGRVPALRIRDARRELLPWRGEQFFAELEDHVHDALIG
jgi:hypothetical protein